MKRCWNNGCLNARRQRRSLHHGKERKSDSHCISTIFQRFWGAGGIYLEDLYVKAEYRGRGIGTAMFRRLAAIARKQGCGRLEWWCLDWNRPSIDFYLSLGEEPMSAWTVYRISGSTLTRLAQEDEE